MVTREQLFIGMRLHYRLRLVGSPVMIVTAITERGFKYTWAERYHYGPRYGYSDGGELFENGFEHADIVDADQIARHGVV